MASVFRNLCLSLALIVVALTSCVDNNDKVKDYSRMSFNASYEQDTKTVLVDRVKVYWQDGDRIAVSGADNPFVTSLTEDSPVAVFEGEAPVSDLYYAVYPYEAVNEISEQIAHLTLSEQQDAVNGTFDPHTGIAVSNTTDQAKDFFFRNVLCYLRFPVTGQTGSLSSITVSSIGGESLSGSFYVDCSSDDPEIVPDNGLSYAGIASDDILSEGYYYLAIFPGTYQQGLAFSFDGPQASARKEMGRSLTLERGKIYTVTTDELEWVPDAAFYTQVQQSYSDWSGDYLITYNTSSTVTVFNSWEGDDKGLSTVDLISKLSSEGIPAEDGDPYKAIVEKAGDHYSVYLTGIGYLGYTGSKNTVAKQDAAPSATDTKFLWDISYKEGGSLWLTNAAATSRRLQWNISAKCFRCYTGSQKDITLYRRTTSTGSVNPDPDTPDPELPNPEPDPDIPDPVPGISGKYGWYELPQISYTQSGSYLIDTEDESLYYAHHICAGNEKGPGGKAARNYTVCYSAEHHCPVWVAAPRHKMYESGANRTDAYAKDPSIPAHIQYNSKSTGGSCNKGHMLGSAERLSSTATNKQVFYYTNIAPQYSSTFNTGGGGWNILEDWVDGKVCSDTLYVVIGTYFETYTDRRGYTDSPATISFGGRDDVTRPSMFYYILLRTKKGNTGKPLSQCTADELMCAAFVRSHATEKGVSVGEKDMMSVSDLEKVTGFSYFPNVPQAPKDTFNASDWGL